MNKKTWVVEFMPTLFQVGEGAFEMLEAPYTKEFTGVSLDIHAGYDGDYVRIKGPDGSIVFLCLKAHIKSCYIKNAQHQLKFAIGDRDAINMRSDSGSPRDTKGDGNG